MSKSWEQILGGYATDTLTEEEKRQMFEAALHDQTLFDTLADEEALKALLADPQARQQILESLQAAGNSNKVSPSPERVRWFRRPSTLAWSGSLAAMGLALIFGWQMENDWGRLVQQEQEAERSVSDEKVQDDSQEVFRSLPAPREKREQVAAPKKKDEVPMPSEAKPQSIPTPVPEADTDRAKNVDRLRQVQGGLENKRQVKEDGLDSTSSSMEEEVVQDSKTFVDAGQPQIEPRVQPLTMPKTDEVSQSEAIELAPARELAAAKAAGEEPLPPPGALDLFYAKIGVGNQDNRRNRPDAKKQNSEKVSSESSLAQAKENNRLSLRGNRVGGETLIQRARGIRYSFLRETAKKEEEWADGQSLAGNWRDVRLAIEPNETGFLYVLAPIGRGNWQQLAGMTVEKQKDTPEAGNVKAYQVVEFPLGGMTNRFGKLVISSVTVLFSPTSLENVSKWVSGSVNQSELQIEQTDYSVYVVRSGLASDAPLRVGITLEE